MSGGRWDYGQRLQAAEDAGRYTVALWDLMKALERELDWGLSGDTCSDCAKLRVAEALVTYFDGYLDDPKRAIAVAQAGDYKCLDCQARDTERLVRLAAAGDEQAFLKVTEPK